MTAIELVAAIKKEKPEILKGIADKKAAILIRLALTQLAQQIAALEEGALNVPALGSFQVRQITREKAGEKVSQKRVIFRAVARKVKV